MCSADFHTIGLDQAVLAYNPGFLAADSADDLMQRLSEELDWQQASISLFGKTVAEPRLTAWHADPGVVYGYSGRRLPAVGWPDSLQRLRRQICAATGHAFNAVLGNLYRDGNDYMGWHSDDEASLGRRPVVASLSLGAERTFVLRRKDDHKVQHRMQLAHGSLLVMQGQTQHYWQHAMPKRLKVDRPRINLTFRLVRSFES